MAQRVAQQHGIVTATDLADDGVSRNAIRRAVTDKMLVRLHSGVYRLATAPDTFESRCTAASRADDAVIVTGLAAARLWGFTGGPRISSPIVTVATDRNPLAKHVTVRRCGDIEDGDWVDRPDGIRIAAPTRMWFDTARDLNDDQFESLTEWVIDHHCQVPTLWAMGRRLGRSGRTGSALVRRVMSQRADWQRPAGSGLELRVLRALRDRGVGELVQQYRIDLPTGITIHADGADVDARWAVEVDHVTWHGRRLKAQQDKGRDRQLRLVKWQVERITDHECATDFDRAIDELVELHALRRAELGLAPQPHAFS